MAEGGGGGGGGGRSGVGGTKLVEPTKKKSDKIIPFSFNSLLAIIGTVCAFVV